MVLFLILYIKQRKENKAIEATKKIVSKPPAKIKSIWDVDTKCNCTDFEKAEIERLKIAIAGNPFPQDVWNEQLMYLQSKCAC